MEPPMSDLFLGRRPIFDRQMEVAAYELFYRSHQSAQAKSPEADPSISQLLVDLFSRTTLDKLVGDKKAMLCAPRSFLLEKNAVMLPADNLVIEVGDAPDQDVITSLNTLSKAGYQIAVRDSAASPKNDLLNLAQIVKLDLRTFDAPRLSEVVAQLKKHRVKLLAGPVINADLFQYCKRLGFDYFQGSFYCQPNPSGGRLDTSRLVVMRSLAKIIDPKSDFRSLGALIAQDVLLSYKLLRLVNSAYYSLPKAVTSIDQAISMIGLNQLRGWMTLILLASVTGKPQELTTTAMLRARMCENMAHAAGQRSADAYFMVGLFSVLDALMDMPMKNAIADLPLAEAVVNGLLALSGAPGETLRLVYAFEREDWDTLLHSAFKPDQISEAFFEAAHWTTEMARSLTETEP